MILGVGFFAVKKKNIHIIRNFNVIFFACKTAGLNTGVKSAVCTMATVLAQIDAFKAGYAFPDVIKDFILKK